MGVAFTIVGFSLLIGTPIEGALLHRHENRGQFAWNHSIVFCGVCAFSACTKIMPMIDRPSSCAGR